MSETIREPELFPGANLLSEADRRQILDLSVKSGNRVVPPVTCHTSRRPRR